MNNLSNTLVSSSLSVHVIPLLTHVKCSCRSCRYIANNRGERFSPCLTPTSQLKYSDRLLLSLTSDLAILYMFLITVITLPAMLYFRTFDHRDGLSTVSNALR